MKLQSDIVQATNQLAEFIASTTYHDIPTNVKEHAKLTLSDTIGVTLRGSSEPEMIRLYKNPYKGKGAIVLKSGFPETNPNVAAYLNAIATSFLELDEGSRPTGHPSLHVFPVSLALSQALNKTGADFITAFIIGYEVQYRIQQAASLRKVVHPHGNFGQVGAVAAIGKIMGWNTEQLRQGINAAAGLTMGTSWKPCIEGATIRNAFPGLTAQIAFTVKDLIESGFTGYDGALYETFGEILGEHFNISALTQDLGDKYGIQENYFKFHAACALVHPALDATTDAINCNSGLPVISINSLPDSKAIIRIKIKVAKNAVRLSMVAKANQLSSKFSIPYAVAMYLLKGDSGLENFQGESLKDKNIFDLAKRVQVVEDDELSNRWPKEAACQVIIEMQNGDQLIGYCSNPYGSSLNPPSNIDLFVKFCSLTKKIFSDSQAQIIWQSLIDIDGIEDLSLIFKPNS